MFESKQMVAAVYARVSTMDQAERGTIESQLDYAQKYCDLNKIKIFKIYRDDGITGTLELKNRPAGRELLEDAKNQFFDTVLVYKLDRLGRATRVILNTIYELEKYHVKIKSMSEPFDTADPSGRFLLTILAGVADLERSNILERMHFGANRAAQEGKYIGGIVPLGYRVKNKFLEVNDDKIEGLGMSEADIVRYIFNAMAGGSTTLKITSYLTARQIPTPYQLHRHKVGEVSGKWNVSSVGRILHNTTYKGVNFFGKRSNKKRELIKREVPSIISTELWDKAHAVMKSHSLRRDYIRHKYLLKGLIKCASCGYGIYGEKTKDGFYYLCNGRRTKRICTAKYIKGEMLDEVVLKDCIKYIENPDLVFQTRSAVKVDHSKEIEGIKKALADNAVAKDKLIDLYMGGIIGMDIVEKKTKQIQSEREILQEKLEGLEKASAVSLFDDKEAVKNFFHYLKKQLKKGTFEAKRLVVESLVDTIAADSKQDNLNLTIKYNFDVEGLSHTDVTAVILVTKNVPVTAPTRK